MYEKAMKNYTCNKVEHKGNLLFEGIKGNRYKKHETDILTM